MKTKIYLLIFFIGLLLSGCLKNRLDGIDNVDQDLKLTEISFPVGFDFSTTQTITLNLKATNALQQSVFEVYTYNENYTELIAKGTFDNNLEYKSQLSIPGFVDSIEIRSLSLGLENRVRLSTLEQTLSYDYGIHYNAERESLAKTTVFENEGTALKSAQVGSFTYMGSFTPNGYPSYLYQVNDHAWE